MKLTLTQILGFWLLYCIFGFYMHRRSRGEATKRIDPKMNVLADEPETVKSVRPTQVKESEREIRESKEVR